LVEIDKAWKKPIYDGSIPVGPGGIEKSMFEIIPDLAPASILLLSIIGLSSATGKSVKTKANFYFKRGNNFSSYG